MKKMDDLKLLTEFLSYPLDTGGPIFERFAELAGAEYRTGEGQQQFLYLRGRRRNKVLLVAHVDTVWHGWNGKDGPLLPQLLIDGPLVRSAAQEFGIGADDRAGCAILWLLRELGHSLLLTDGEENGRKGSRWLMEDPGNRDIRVEIQRDHRFLVQFDRRNGRDFKCYDVGTEIFRAYVTEKTGYSEPDRNSFTDIVTLCRDLCGVNLSVGYRNEHSARETLNIVEWENTLNLAGKWLSEPDLPVFSRP